MDRNYQDRIQYRRKILKEHHDVVVAVNDDSRIGPAVRESYRFLFGTYLPVRYPSMFKLHKTEYEQSTEIKLQKLITSELLPVQPKSKTVTLLRRWVSIWMRTFFFSYQSQMLRRGLSTFWRRTLRSVPRVSILGRSLAENYGIFMVQFLHMRKG
jgi:hypothetical protein